MPPITDIALAAYLHAEGIELLSVDRTEFLTKFLFSNSSPKVAECIRLYECGQAMVNTVQYYRSYKIMISNIKDSKNNRNVNR